MRPPRRFTQKKINNMKTRKIFTAIYAFLSIAFSMPPMAVTAARTPYRLAANEDPGLGKGIDPGTGKPFDFRKMVMGLLGLGDDADDNMVNTAFKSCMNTKPESAAIAMKAELQKANEDLLAANAKVDGQKSIVLKIADTEIGTIMVSNETTGATIIQKISDLVKRATDAEAAFANERNERSKVIVNFAGVGTGRITKAESDAQVKILANAKTPAEFDAAVTAINSLPVKYQTTSSTTNLGRTLAPGTAGQKFTEMVNEAVAADTTKRANKWDYHWQACGKSEKGKAMLAEMRQPAKQQEQTKPAK